MAGNLVTLLVGIACAMYFLMAIVALRYRALGARLAYVFALYAAVAYLWELAQVAARLGWLASVRADFLAHLPLLGLLLLTMFFLHLSRSFLRLEGLDLRWWVASVAAFAALLVADTNALNLREVWWSGAGWEITRATVVGFALIFGWGVLTGAATLVTARAYRRTQQPLHRNRIKYWVPALTLMVAGDAALFAGQAALGTGLRLAGTLIVAYVVLTHNLPDVRRIARRVLSFVIITVLTVAIYLGGFLGMQYAFQAVPGYSPLFIGAALAVVLALLFNPLLGLVQRLVNRLVSGTGYDASRTLREYGLSISNILEIERLASVALGLIHKTIGILRGMLFLVDERGEADGETYFELRGVKGMGIDLGASGRLVATSPLVVHLQQEHFPVMQYDIDLLPRFRGMADDERAWLSSLGMDVYVPIHSKGRWIGLLALGPKVSGDRYFDDDLIVLATLADQTAVALENARLVEDLVRLNHDLDGANHQLEHLDRTKSDFISVVSHELRTPMAIMLGYSQILVTDPTIQASADNFRLVDGLCRGATRMEEIVESMLDMAMIDTRTLQLSPNPVDIAEVIEKVRQEFEEALVERQLKIEARELGDLPHIEADEEALRKVFRHLIVNAIKYTPNGGRITVSGRRLPPAQDNGTDEHVEVVVSDTGIGIEPQFLELVFTKFYQTGQVAVHSSGRTKFKGGGPGLGLTIARGIVEAHGGKIWAESAGHDEANCPGSQFYVVMPVRQTVPEPVLEPAV
jgi:signal transduction histidine kinase